MSAEGPDLQKEIKKYLIALTSMLTKGEKTASGTTDDQTPQEPPQVAGMKMLSTDGRKLGNPVFAGGKAKIPAELIALGDIYDTTQACTRIASLYNKSREAYYKEAKEALEVNKARIERKMALAVSLVNNSKEPKKAQTQGE